MSTKSVHKTSQVPQPQEKTKAYLAAYFLLSLASWLLTNKAAGIASMWVGPEHFGDFAVSIRLAHNMAHLFVMGQEATILMYLSQYHDQPHKQSGLVRWIICSTLTKTVLLLSIIALFTLTPTLSNYLALRGINIGYNYWLGFLCIPFVVTAGIYERFFLFMQQFFTSFLSRGIYQPILFITAIWVIQKYSNSSAGVALLLYALTYFLAACIYAIQGFFSPFSLTAEYDDSDKK